MARLHQLALQVYERAAHDKEDVLGVDLGGGGRRGDARSVEVCLQD